MTSLTINIDKTGRQFLIDNDEKIIIICPQIDSTNSIVCIAFNPFGDTNTVEFDNDFKEYASSQAITPMAVIEPEIMTEVTQGMVYVFNGNSFDHGSPITSSSTYGLSYQSSSGPAKITVGLEQKISYNPGTSEYLPICAYSVPNNQTVYLESSSIIRIFVANGISSNMIIPNTMLTPSKTALQAVSVIIGNYLEIDLTETSSIAFNNNTHCFVVN